MHFHISKPQIKINIIQKYKPDWMPKFFGRQEYNDSSEYNPI